MFFVCIDLFASDSCRKAFEQDKQLITAVKEGDIKKIKQLLDKDADINAKDDLGQTSLMWSSIFGDVKTVTLLLEKGADIYAINQSGQTALSLAMGYKQKIVAKLLLDKQLKQGLKGL